MQFPRASGVLLHPTSLPGRYGIGDLGEWAYRFIDYLETANQTLWQVLPLGPTSYGDSPYQAISAFAGNPLLISFDLLVSIGWLTTDDLTTVPEFSDYAVDFGNVITYHDQILTLARKRFHERGTPEQKHSYQQWCAAQASWLDDFTLFAALKDANSGRAWVEWSKGQALRQPEALAAARQEHADRMDDHRFRQWVFFQQWGQVKAYANSKGIKLIGDIPIFAAHDSSDVWTNRELFFLDENGNPTVIAGVPPDYFSPTGQRWGNPLYNWPVNKQEGYRWWINRFRGSLALVDIIRVDHFRGFDAYWEVPASEETAENGKWVTGPGEDFFTTLEQALGELPIIAEDLGLMTPTVTALRDKFNLPGMKVLQFAWGDVCGEDPFVPHNHVPNCVVYTGTHDNNTTVGWWQSGEGTKEQKECFARYLGHEIQEPHWELIRMGLMSVGHTFVVPLQDVLGFGADTRMNMPGRLGGNWTWRFTPEWLKDPSRDRLAQLTRLYQRAPKNSPFGYIQNNNDHNFNHDNQR